VITKTGDDAKLIVGDDFKALSNEDLVTVATLIAEHVPEAELKAIPTKAKKIDREALHRESQKALDKAYMFPGRLPDGTLCLVPQSQTKAIIGAKPVKFEKVQNEDEADAIEVVNPKTRKRKLVKKATTNGQAEEAVTTKPSKRADKVKAAAKTEKPARKAKAERKLSTRAKGDFTNDQKITLVKANRTKDQRSQDRYPLLKSGMTVGQAITALHGHSGRRDWIRKQIAAGAIELS
jgi:hypothetical protein